MKMLEKVVFPLFVLALLALSPSVAEAQSCKRFPDQPKCQTDPGTGTGGTGGTGGDTRGPWLGGDLTFNNEASGLPPTYSWMHGDVGIAFSHGFDGTGSHMITVDNFGGTTYSGNLDGTQQGLTHGAWTLLQSHLVAPGASQTGLSNTASGSIVGSYSDLAGLNVVNLSFGLFDPAGTNVNASSYTLGSTLWDSLVDEAKAGSGVFVKAAGNTNGGTVDGTVRMFMPRPTQMVDVLNLSFVGADGAIFVGALDGNGTSANPASIASYSTIAGSDTAIQDMFLVVGVESGITGLAGTSFAAPIVTGYAAIIGDKYNETLSGAERPGALVVDRLLETARTDTIAGFGLNGDCTQVLSTDSGVCTRSTIYGVGEADLSRAIAPDRIPF